MQLVVICHVKDADVGVASHDPTQMDLFAPALELPRAAFLLCLGSGHGFLRQRRALLS